MKYQFLIILLSIFILFSCKTIDIPDGYFPITNDRDEVFYEYIDKTKGIHFTKHEFFLNELFPVYVVRNNDKITMVFSYKGDRQINFDSVSISKYIYTISYVKLSRKKIYDKAGDVFLEFAPVRLFDDQDHHLSLRHMLSTIDPVTITFHGDSEIQYVLEQERVDAIVQSLKYFFSDY